MKLTILYILVLLLISGCAFNGTQIANKRADLLFSQGSSKLMTGEYTSALINLTKANQIRPDDSSTLLNLAMAYYFKNDLQKAKKYLIKAKDADKNNFDADNNLASIYLQEGKVELAQKLYLKTSKILDYKKQYRVFYNLGIIALKRQQKLKAIEYFNRSVQEKNTYCPSHIKLGILYRQEKNYILAQKSFNKAIKGDCYNSPAPHYELALTYMRIGEYFKSKHKFKHVIIHFPKSKYASLAKEQIKRTLSEVILGTKSIQNTLQLPLSATKQNIKHNNNINNSRQYKSPQF